MIEGIRSNKWFQQNKTGYRHGHKYTTILTVTTVWNTGETGDINSTKHVLKPALNDFCDWHIKETLEAMG